MMWVVGNLAGSLRVRGSVRGSWGRIGMVRMRINGHALFAAPSLFGRLNLVCRRASLQTIFLVRSGSDV